MDSLFTWDVIGTLAGAAGLTYLIVAYTKDALKSLLGERYNSNLYAVAVGAAVLATARFATGPVDWSVAVLALFNGFLVAAAAGKMNDMAQPKQQ